jgi:hypothetical protein
MMKAEDVFEKSTVGFGIFAVNNYMSASNHRCRRHPTLRFTGKSRVILSPLATISQLDPWLQLLITRVASPT